MSLASSRLPTMKMALEAPVAAGALWVQPSIGRAWEAGSRVGRGCMRVLSGSKGGVGVGGHHRSESANRKALFNRIAPLYDNLNDWISLGQHTIWKRMALSWTGVKWGDQVLDICCGTGDLTFLLAEKVGPQGKVTGLDFAEEQLLMAFHRQKNSPVPSHQCIEWIHGDALNLPFLDASFDAVTMGYGLRNVTDIPLSLHEIYRVLKKGCKASMLDFNRPTNPSIDALQGWILSNMVVPVAACFGLRDEYAYLKTSISQFPTGKEQEILAAEVGFSQARHFEIAAGLMGVLVVHK